MNHKQIIDYSNHQCLVCGRLCDGRRSLGNHINRSHSIDLEQYVLSYILGDIKPKCGCGCGSDVTWHKIKYVFNDYITGHNPSGFRVAQPKFSAEQIIKRNNAIKTSYKNKMLVSASISQNNITSSSKLEDKVVASLHDAIKSFNGPAKLRFKFNDDNHPIITREQLIRINETTIFPSAPGRDFTEKILLPLIKQFYREYVKVHGWFYPVCDDSIDDAVRQVKSHAVGTTKHLSSLGNAGSKYLKSKFKSFWNVDEGPVKSFQNDKKLEAVLRYRLGLNNSKPYHYTLSDGQSVDCRETFDINIKNIRFGFIVQRASVSWFKPTAAYEIYKRFLKNEISSPVVWDPSCGFGARLLGFASAFPRGTYIGTDPANETFNDLVALTDDLKNSIMTKNMIIDIRKQGSEIGLSGVDDASVDLVFTSPPYFDRERYFDESGQCWRDYPTSAEWLSNYVAPTLREAYRIIKPDSHLVLNVDEKNESIFRDAAITVGFKQLDSLRLKIGRDHFSKKQGHNEIDKSEPILVFKK